MQLNTIIPQLKRFSLPLVATAMLGASCAKETNCHTVIISNPQPIEASDSIPAGADTAEYLHMREALNNLPHMILPETRVVECD